MSSVELSVTVIQRRLFTFGFSSTIFSMLPISGNLQDSYTDGRLFCYPFMWDHENSRLANGSLCDLSLIVPVCGLRILKALASWG